MYKVGTNGVPPVHVAPFRAIGVVLVAEMIDAIFVEHAVGVVHPAVSRRVVVGRTIEIGVGYVPFVGQAHGARFQNQCRRLYVEHLNHRRSALV